MAPQQGVFFLYLFLAAVVAGVFAWVAASSRRPGEVDPAAAGRLRLGFLALLVVILGAALGLTIDRLPYDLFEGEIPDRVVFVTGKQFAFAVSESPVEDGAAWERATIAPPVTVTAGEVIEFRVSTLDVHHGVGIFDPHGRLLGQVQSIPGYLNRLRMRFDRAGRYFILCLELCGNGHARMRGVLEVEAPAAVAERRRAEAG